MAIDKKEKGKIAKVSGPLVVAEDMFQSKMHNMVWVSGKKLVGEIVELNAEASGGTGSYSYSWTSNPEGFVSDEQNPAATPAETTTYIVEVSDGEYIVNGEVEVTVDPLPDITLGDWPDLLCNQEEPPVQLTASPEGGTYSGNNVTPNGIFSSEEAPLGWNVITYIYEDENGCENLAIDSIFVDQCVGVSEQKLKTVAVYPNPDSKTPAIGMRFRFEQNTSNFFIIDNYIVRPFDS